MTLPPPVLYIPAKHVSILPQIVQIHADCVLTDNTLATFLPNENREMDLPKLLAYWQQRSDQVAAGTRAIILQFTDDSESELAGTSVEKLMVSPKHRRKGVARRVMEKLEDVARETGSELMVLDTTIGTPAEHVYPKLGYIELGKVPKYGISPKDGKLVDEIFFHKDLRDHSEKTTPD